MQMLRTISRSRGYSFTEVMFAVVVLGIGFIMIAAMFPVAISQQQSTQQETNAAAFARGAASYFETIATNTLLPASGTAAQPNRPLVLSVRNPQSTNPAASLPNEDLWNALKGNLIVAGDQRYGIVMLYRREGDSADATRATWKRQAQLIVIVTQVRNRSTYNSDDVFATTPPTAPAGYNLQARPVVVDVTSDGTGPVVDQRVTFKSGQTGSVAEGSYLIISDDNLTATNEGVLNGRIYRIGSHVAGDEWELAAGNDFAPYDPDGSGPSPAINGLTDANAFVVGRNVVTGGYEGLAQDIAVYTTFVQVR
jgi:hypothetical protein